MRSIKQLPEAVHSSVRSGIMMYDLTRVVEELVFNSLDAGATKISVALNVGTCCVKVVDNGYGVTRDGLVLLGERYATSKHDHLADVGTISGSFGFRGEALGSISDVSLLEIITRTHGMPNGYRKVMKGCSCLYLGISDDREDVGTTVIVRDLFYNQPVRRKHMQSSPKKVLHSVKNCVLRIALVHSEASFRVVDTESEDELLCTGPSPSPLPLLMSGFGIDASSFLSELNVSDGVLKLSGYISGPCDILSSKAFQYIYINSRFVCKGPIHKLLNQLAIRFNSVDQWKLNSGSRNVKHSHPQICPTFLLKLTCQRSLYDITFEPSRTSVEFKDWGPVLTFIESSITRFWVENTSDALPVKRDTGKKRCRTQKCEASFDLPPSPLQITEGCTILSAWSECQNSFKKSSQDAPEFKNHQTGDEFFYQADCSVQSYDGSAAHLGGAMGQEISNFLELSPHTIISVEDTFLDNELFAIERPNKQVKCNLSSGWEDIPIKFDAENRDILVRSGLSADSVDFSDITYVNQDNLKPFLRSCSSRRSLLHDDSYFDSDERFEPRTDNFRMKGKWHGLDDGDQIFKARSPVHDRASYVWSSPRSRTQHFKKTYPDSFPEDQMNSRSSASGDLDEDNYILSDLFKPIQESFDSDCSPVISDPFVGNRFRDDHFIDEDEAVSPSELNKDARYEYFTDKPVDGCNFSLDSINGLGQEKCSFSKLYSLQGPAGNRGDISGSRDFYPKNDIFSSCSDTFTDETDWLWSQSNGKEALTNCSVPVHNTSFDDGDGDTYRWIHIRNQGKQLDCRKRAIRSHSAPPFYRGRKKFFALNNSFILAPGKRKSPIFHDAPILPETSLEHLQHCSRTNSFRHPNQSSSQYHLSSIRNPVDDISEARTSPDIAVVQNSKLHRQGHGINSCNADSVEDSRSRRAEDLLDSGLKWRGTFPLSAGGGISPKCKNEDSILDISSVNLHLCGDSPVPNSIDKSCLEHAKVLQQVDKKFIPIVAGRTLAIIDQHAADERIRLEELRQKVLSGELKTITYLDTEQELVLPEIGYQLLYNYAEQIQSWGWICNIHSRDSKSFTKNLKVLHRQPTVTRLLAVPCILGVNLTDVDLSEYLQQLADTDGSSTIPPAVHRVLNNKACRGAIMFGDTLLPSECSLIVEELKQTSLCFQCAHGRPTTVPLVNLDVLHKQIATLGLGSNGSCESWHGFHRHKISIERAARRLG